MIIAVVLWIVAFAFILVTSINVIRRTVKLKKCTAETAGEITEIKELVRRRNGIITREYHPTITYEIDGTAYVRKYTKAYRADAYKVGQVISVSYDPRKPEQINTSGTSNTADFVMMAAGVIIGVIGAVVLMLQ